jgi:hypothetical protein
MGRSFIALEAVRMRTHNGRDTLGASRPGLRDSRRARRCDGAPGRSSRGERTMRLRSSRIAVLTVSLIPVVLGVAHRGATEEPRRPMIRKLGTLNLDLVEATPVVFRDRLYRFEYVRPGYVANSTGDPQVAIDRRQQSLRRERPIGWAFSPGSLPHHLTHPQFAIARYRGLRVGPTAIARADHGSGLSAGRRDALSSEVDVTA